MASSSMSAILASACSGSAVPYSGEPLSFARPVVTLQVYRGKTSCTEMERSRPSRRSSSVVSTVMMGFSELMSSSNSSRFEFCGNCAVAPGVLRLSGKRWASMNYLPCTMRDDERVKTQSRVSKLEAACGWISTAHLQFSNEPNCNGPGQMGAGSIASSGNVSCGGVALRLGGRFWDAQIALGPFVQDVEAPGA